MLASYVLRLVTDELRANVLVGEVVSVETGRARPFNGVPELIAFCREDQDTVLPTTTPESSVTIGE